MKLRYRRRLITLFFTIILSLLLYLPTWSQVSSIDSLEYGIYLWQSGKTIEAILEWEKLIKYGEKNREILCQAYLMLAQAYLELGHTHLAWNALELSEKYIKSELTPISAGIEGNIALAEKDYLRAISAYEKAPISIATFNNLSIAYEKRSKIWRKLAAEARWEGDEVLEAQRNNKAQGDLAKSRLNASKAINTLKANPEVSLNSARSWLRWAQFGHLSGAKIAIEILNQLHDSKPKGDLLIKLSEFNQSTLDLAKSVALSLDNSRLLAQIALKEGNILELKGQFSKAENKTLQAFEYSAQSYPKLSYLAQWQLGVFILQRET